MTFQILGVDHCVIYIIYNLGLSVLYMTVQMTELEIPLHAKNIKQNGKNMQNIKLIKLDQEFVE